MAKKDEPVSVPEHDPDFVPVPRKGPRSQRDRLMSAVRGINRSHRLAERPLFEPDASWDDARLDREIRSHVAAAEIEPVPENLIVRSAPHKA